MSAHFGTITQCPVKPTVPKCVLIKFQNSSKFCSVWLILEKLVSASVIGQLPIFFYDQTIFLKDYELYIIGHSLVLKKWWPKISCWSKSEFRYQVFWTWYFMNSLKYIGAAILTSLFWSLQGKKQCSKKHAVCWVLITRC